MSAWIVPPVEAMIEPAPAPEFFVSDIGAIERLPGGVARFYLCARRMAGNEVCDVIAVKIVRPIDTIPTMLNRLARCAARGGAPQLPWPLLVR